MSILKLKLKKVDAVKYGLITGATMALLMFAIMVIMFLFTSLISLAGLGSDVDGLGVGAILGGGVFMIILGPIMYFIFGFIFGWIGALILNFILKKTDGLALEFEKSSLGISEIGKE